MARTFIKYKEDKGFEINEAYVQLAFSYIYQEMKKTQYSFSNKQEILESLEDDINGYTYGYLVLMWHDDLVNQSDEQTMLQVLQNVKTALQSKGAYISVAELQTIPTEDKDFKRFYGRYPFPTSELIKVIDALIQMLQGTWESTNYNMDINY